MKFSRKTLGIPYALFLLLFVVIPLVVLFYYAFTNGQGQFTLHNLIGFFTDRDHRSEHARNPVLQLFDRHLHDFGMPADRLSGRLYPGYQQTEE